MKIPLETLVPLVKLFAPLLLAQVKGGDKIAAHVDRITDAIIEAQQLPGASGAEKKAHVQAIVLAGVAEANASGKVYLDPAEATAIADHGIDTIIGTLKLVHGARPVAAASSTADALGVHAGSTGE